MTKSIKRWTDAEIDYIKSNYKTLTARELSVHLKRHPEVVRTQIRKMGLISPFLHNKNNTSQWLLEDSLESFYWTGFLLADGNFKKYGDSIVKIRCTLSAKDRSHLQKLADRFNTRVHNKISNGREQVELSVIDTAIVPQYANKFNITTNKTYSPPSVQTLSKFSDYQLLSLLIGFIDGDGCITKPKYKGNGNSIIVVSHTSWIDNLKLLNEVLYRNSGYEKTTQPYITNGYVRLTWSNRALLTYLKNFSITNNLPILERKWGRISYYNARSHVECPEHNDKPDYD